MANKTFEQVKLNVAFGVSAKRENISTGENISTISGKIAKWYSDFNSVVWDGNASKVNGHTVGVNVPANAKFTDTTYSNFVKSGSGAKAGLVPAPSTTAGTTKYLREDGTWTVPPNTNTDTLVKQSTSTTANFRPVILGYNYSTDVSTLDSDVTNQVYATTKIYAKPSTGDIYTAGNLFVLRGVYASNGDPNGSGHTMLVGHDGDNLWIGSYNTAGPHHKGETMISSGYNTSTNKGYPSVKIIVPNDTNDGGTAYTVLHNGNTYHNITSSDDLWSSIDVSLTSEYIFKVLRGGSGVNDSVPTWFASKYGPGIVFGGLDTKGVMSLSYNTPKLTLAGGINDSDHTKPSWYMSLTGTTGKTYNLDSFSATSHTHSYLPLSGGIITGKIAYNSGTRISNLFLVDDGDAGGSMYSGPHTGGLVVIGSGESSTSIRNAILSEDGLDIPTGTSKFVATSERLILSSDSNIYFMTNCNAIANKKTMLLTTDLNLHPDTTETGSVGTSSYKWNTMHAKTFYGALSGNATSATQVTSTFTSPTTTAVRYWIPFHDTGGTTGAKSIRHSNSLCCHVFEGTTEKDGYTYLELGNVTPSGTNGNSYGVLRICAKNDKYQNILPNTITQNTNITLPASSGTLALTSSNITGSSAKWTTARNINGLSVDGSANRVNYGTCSTAAATAAKTVACTGFAGGTGSEITVKFTVTNTAANPTLNVNSTGAKPIYYRGAAISAGYLAANRTYTFRFNGTQYELVGDLNTNTDTEVTVTGINATPLENYGIIRPLLFAASTANSSNELESIAGQVSDTSKCTSYTGGVNMNGGIYVKTNYNTTSGNIGQGYIELHVVKGTVVADKFIGTADDACKLTSARTINGVDFDGTNNISITKCLYSGTGDTSVTLSESQSNYDLLIIVTNRGTFLHRVGSAFSFHTFNNYPAPSPGGTDWVNIRNFSINDQTDKKLKSQTSTVELKGSGSTATSSNVTDSILITEVYGLKFS